MRGKEIFRKLVSCVDVTPDQITHNWQMLAVFKALFQLR